MTMSFTTMGNLNQRGLKMYDSNAISLPVMESKSTSAIKMRLYFPIDKALSQ